MKLLVRAPNWIGDQILAYPFFHQLRRSYPQARITVVCVDWVASLQFREQVDEVVVLPRGIGLGKWARWKVLDRFARDLKKKHGPFDLGISLPNSFSAAWLLFRAGCAQRRGFGFEGRGFILNDRRSWEEAEKKHRAEAYLSLAAELGETTPELGEFYSRPAENELDDPIPGTVSLFDAEAEWGSQEPLNPPAGDYWILAPGSQAESRRWPLESFMHLASEIADRTGLVGVVAGGPTEAPLATRLCADPSRKLLDRTAHAPLQGLWRLFRGAQFVVTNDSGLAHYASLCGAPTVVVWGAGNPARTRPIGPGPATLVFNSTDCWPCERNSCFQPDDRKLECLRGIPQAAVIEEIKRVVRGVVKFRDR